MFAAEMDTTLGLSFDSGKAGILTDLPIAVAAATMGITTPPIHCGTAIPSRAQAKLHRLNLGEKLCSVFLGSAAAKGIRDLAAGVINEDARGPRLGARDFPARLITAIGVSFPVAVERTPRPGVELDVELGVGTHREFLDSDHFEFAEFGLCEVDRVLQDREWQCKNNIVGSYICKLITDLKCERVSARGISAQRHERLARDDLRA